MATALATDGTSTFLSAVQSFASTASGDPAGILAAGDAMPTLLVIEMDTEEIPLAQPEDVDKDADELEADEDEEQDSDIVEDDSSLDTLLVTTSILDAADNVSDVGSDEETDLSETVELDNGTLDTDILNEVTIPDDVEDATDILNQVPITTDEPDIDPDPAPIFPEDALPEPTITEILWDMFPMDALIPGTTTYETAITLVTDQAGMLPGNVAAEYTSSNPWAATIDEYGMITANGAGTTEITAWAQRADGSWVESETMIVPVIWDHIVNFRMSDTLLTMLPGDVTMLAPLWETMHSGQEDPNFTVRITTSDAGVAVLNGDVITALNPGMTTILAEGVIDGQVVVTAACAVIVESQDGFEDNYTFDGFDFEVYPNQTDLNASDQQSQNSSGNVLDIGGADSVLSGGSINLVESQQIASINILTPSADDNIPWHEYMQK